MEVQSAGATGPSNYGGILLAPTGNLANILISGNIVTNSPLSGIRIWPNSPYAAQRIRITDNTIVDAGNDSQYSSTTDKIYRHAIGINGVASDIDIQRNMIYDTGAPSGVYSLYLQPVAPSVNVRTSQNTVRVAGSGPPLLAPQSTVGQLDSTSAGDVKTSSVGAGQTLSVDFMSFSRYVTTIGSSVTVDHPPVVTAPNLNFTHGQVVIFRFLCSNTGGTCTVNFDPFYAVETGWDAIPDGMGRAIAFQVEVPPSQTQPPAHFFFQVYRSANVPNPGGG